MHLNGNYTNIKMRYRVKDTQILSKILWIDFIMGATTGLLGLVFLSFFTSTLGFPENIIIWISAITLLYSLFALKLATMKTPSIPQLRILIFANWTWTIISLGISVFHFSDATLFGKAFLILQIIVVGGLAWLEGNQLEKS